MRHAVLLLAVLNVACASAKMAGRDIVAVAKAPVREWKTVATAAAVTSAALLIDDEVADAVRRNQSSVLDEFAETIEPFGGGHSDKVIAGFLLYGLAAKNERAKNIAFDAFVSSVIASKGITPALKQLIHKTRPSGEGEESFPSNHATQAFAVATVIAMHHEERRWVRWLAYGVAGGVAFARIYHDDHWTSDVLAGAAIGTFVARTVVRTNRVQLTTDGRRVLITMRW